MVGIPSRFKKAWNVFTKKDKRPNEDYESYKYAYSAGSASLRPYIPKRIRNCKNKTILSAIYTRIATDVASVDIEHCRLDENLRYVETINSTLNRILTEEANIDETGRDFVQNIVASMFEWGSVALVPIDTDTDPDGDEGNPTIYSMRVGRIVTMFPYRVKVRAWNERTGSFEDLTLAKDSVAIITNPFYDVMNENNSVVDRLTRKLAILDAIDEQSGSGKLDLIIQLPYIIKNDTKRKQAEQRRRDIEDQLSGNKLGIAYIDGTERVVQLNRSVENNLLNQIQYLTDMLYSQLGLTPAVFNGTANEQEMLNYYNRTVEPILSAICNEIRRKFLTRTARTQGQSIMFFRDPFKLVPINQLADMADKFTRNEILTSNEVRAMIGYKPSSEPNADELRNKNLNQSPEAMAEEQKIGEEQELREETEQKS